MKSKVTGRAVGKATAYRFFRNIFYTGLFDYRGERFSGKHQPMITLEEYNQAQELLQIHKRTPPPKQEGYYFMQLFTCGECGCAITAEQHTKRYVNGSQQTFVYARCTKKRGSCSQHYLNAKVLDKQIREFVASLEIHPSVAALVLVGLEQDQQRTRVTKKSNLKKRKSFEESVTDLVGFASHLNQIFQIDDVITKRVVLKILGTKFILKEKHAEIDVKKTFLSLKELEKQFLDRSAALEPIKSLSSQYNQLLVKKLVFKNDLLRLKYILNRQSNRNYVELFSQIAG